MNSGSFMRCLIKREDSEKYVDSTALPPKEVPRRTYFQAVKTVMIPRSRMETIPLSLQGEELLATVLSKQHSRLPVVGEDNEHIIGIVHSSEICHKALKKGRSNLDLFSLLQPTLCISESMEIRQAVLLMWKQHISMGVVLDAAWRLSGLVTIEDMISRINQQNSTRQNTNSWR